MILRKGGLLLLVIGMLITSGVGQAEAQVGAPTFTDNPSPFPFVHSGVGGSGVPLSGQLVTTEGVMGSGSFFVQEFVNVTIGGAAAPPQLAIHSVLEASQIGTSFIQESFVLMGSQRSPTTQNNTTSPVTPPPSQTSIAFRQSLTGPGFSTTSSLDPGQDIHIHQQVDGGAAVAGQAGGLSFTNVDILPNFVVKGQEATDPSCGTTSPFCTTISQEVKVTDALGATVFSQNMDFTTGGSPTIVQVR
ncbi:MAG: hypothetical protein ACE5F7_00035 [Nitrospiria bacterium]